MRTSPQTTVDVSQDAIPRWDARDRCLWIGKVLVKKFGALAPAQEFLLASLEREGWKTPLRIVSLPGKSKRKLQGCLHDAVRGLNRLQQVGRIFFFRTGLGNEIGWELTPTHKRKPKVGP